MPTCRRKRVLLTEPSQALLDTLKSDQHKEVYYLAQTGEIFDSYEAYSARMSFYRMKHFQCEVTGKSGLDYFQAIESEQQEARTMHSRFPEPLKAAVLKSVQWQVMGRLDHLVEAVFDRFKDRYFPDEKIIIDVQGDKYFARVVQVFPPRPTNPQPSPEPEASTSASPLPPDDEPIHKIVEDLTVPVKDSVSKDDPNKYYYKVQILEEERQPGTGKSGSKAGKQNKFSGSLMDVQCRDMSRDRLAFSKSILRRFIRDCVDRDPAVASPWVVKPTIAARYGVNSVMPEEIRKGVETLKKGESDKRKKVWEDREGPSKRQKKLLADEEKAKALAERREREAKEKEEKVQKVKEESERLANEKKKKKPVRYPTEDLDITIGDKEKKAGMKLKKPAPSRSAMPFGHDKDTNEMFLMSWNFLVVYGQPLHISTFTMDDYEAALRHSVIDPPCPLLAEIHSTLIYNLRTVPSSRHSAVISLTEAENDRVVLGVSTEELVSVLADIGNNWERAPLRHPDGRYGWEESLIGCLKDHATLENFPRLQEILTRLLFAPESEPQAASSSSNATPAASPVLDIHDILKVPSSPRDRYHTLSPVDKLTILSFMCNMAVSSKAIHIHMEACEEQLTALRKEKIEVNRSKKAFVEEMAILSGESNGTPKPNGAEEDGVAPSELSDAPGSDVDMDTPGGTPTRKPKENRRKTAKEREIARAKQASAKQAMAEHRRLNEEVNKLERRLEGIEREFRKLLGAVRVKPLGRDRFYNRIWWFDGMGAASLIGSGGAVQYGSGRIFIQGPSEHDVELLTRREEDIQARRLEEEGVEGMLGVGEWAVYDDIEVADEFVAWLNPKGVRELALKNTLAKWWPHIGPGMRRRAADLTATAKVPEARRSARMKHPGSDLSRESYMLWTNRRAVNSS
ncbi:chromatin remodeling complex protein [Cristinia sonorae]|uniref:Chromatin remodeling complex protein n=1 Tax=Cristinia sonorae TaxID=1940300 RepID=A0A8K0UPX0_9AGAR|nr:chromatin remodeling complex protein [Cristinia sonorae]